MVRECLVMPSPSFPNPSLRTEKSNREIVASVDEVGLRVSKMNFRQLLLSHFNLLGQFCSSLMLYFLEGSFNFFPRVGDMARKIEDRDLNKRSFCILFSAHFQCTSLRCQIESNQPSFSLQVPNFYVTN